MCALLLDIGGTWMRLGSGKAGEAPLLARTPNNLTDAKLALRSLINEARKASNKVADVVVSIGGLVDRAGLVHRSIYTPFAGVEIPTLMRELGLRTIHVENDAKFQLRGLPRSGLCVLISVGTGVGGAAGFNAVPLADASAFGGEFGHAYFTGTDQDCACGQRGCIDLVLGGRAIAGKLGDSWYARALDDDALRYFEFVAHQTHLVTTSLLRLYDPRAIFFVGRVFQQRSLRSAVLAAVSDHWARARCAFVTDSWTLATKALSRVVRHQQQEHLVA